MPRMLSHRLPSRSSSYRSLFPPGSFPPCSSARIPTTLLFFISLYGLIPSFPRRARYIYRLVSPSGSCLYHTATSPGPLAVRPPKLSRRHDLCFLRPSGGLIPFCCRMYTCAAAPPSLSHPNPFPLSPCTLTREHRSPAHD